MALQAIRILPDGAACDRSSAPGSDRLLSSASACSVTMAAPLAGNPQRTPLCVAAAEQMHSSPSRPSASRAAPASPRGIRPLLSAPGRGLASTRYHGKWLIGTPCLRRQGREGTHGVRAMFGEREECTFSARREIPAWSTSGMGYASHATSVGPSPPAYPAWGSADLGECSIARAFSSMVTMLKALQSYALQAMYDDFQSVAGLVHKEMQASFLWLFQQVFSCTPMLMVAVMLLFSDFTVFSASNSLTPAEPSLAARRPPSVLENIFQRSAPSPPSSLSTSMSSPFDIQHAPTVGISGRGSGYFPTQTFPVLEVGDRSLGGGGGSGRVGIGSPASSDSSDERGLSALGRRDSSADPSNRILAELMEATVKEMAVKEGQRVIHLRLDQEVIRQLVAPIKIQLEKDDYECFDRTDLLYQLAISEDPHNPMLLSNYAQFLYIVRRNFDRAETFFQRALKEDPADGDILGRYATFLWLGRGDTDAADRAYKAALATNPNNPYHTGSYAHFLWHSGDDETTCPLV